VEFLRKAEGLEPDDPRVLNALGVAHLQAGDPAAALRPLRHSLEVAPAQPEVAAIVRELEGSSP
jgi:Flp pilus assembly protein TadD